MASSTDPKTNPAEAGEAQEGTNVNKIRDILFGSQMRDYERRFAGLEDRLAKAIDSLREEMKKQMDSLEVFNREEIESLGQRLKTEKADRADSLKQLARELQDASKGLEKKLSESEEQAASSQSDLRAKILEQSKTFTKEMERLQREVAANLDREVQGLRLEKMDRAALADLFNEFALRLRDQLPFPKE
jgi:DNA repair exonuclease SbcCD ATPase subunit